MLTASISFAQRPSLDSAGRAIQSQKLATMQDILQSIATLNEELNVKEAASNEAETDESKDLIAEEIKVLHERLHQLEKDFNILSTGIDQELFFDIKQEELIWEDEMKEIFSPLIYEMKEITSKPREIERLRSSIPFFQRRVNNMDLALANIDTLSRSTQNPVIKGRLEDLTEFWSNHQQEHQSELETMLLQLDQLEKKKKGFGEAMGEISNVFFKKRGKNLFFAILIFIITFLTLRYIHRLIYRYVKIKAIQKRRFLLRVVDILYYLFTILASIGLFFSALYIASDWVLLGLSVILLLGLIWAGKNALPSFFSQARLLLNLGPVREGERVMYNDVPWEVISLNIYSELRNPELEGGSIRLPIKDLLNMRSRPFGKGEPWFPSRVGDWVKLSDGYYGKVYFQTPESVGIETQRGAYKTYPVADYLTNKPQNLSRNFFSVNRIIEIDFKYRDRVNDEIAPAIKAYFEEAVLKEPYGHYLEQVLVELEGIRASSLGIICILKFKGGTSSEYYEIGWKIEQIALDALNHLNIEIPFPHLAIHKKEEKE